MAEEAVRETDASRGHRGAGYRMPMVDGLEAARLMPPWTRRRVIFCTAYDEYALKAFEAHRSTTDEAGAPGAPQGGAGARDRAVPAKIDGVAHSLGATRQRSHICARVRGNLVLVRSATFYICCRRQICLWSTTPRARC